MSKRGFYQRSKIWWTDFTVDGQRFRQSLETTNWNEAQAKYKDLIAQAKEGKLGSSYGEFARLGFGEAADRYLQGRKLELSESSRKKEKQLLVKPRKFFGSKNLAKLTGENLLAFREWRTQDHVGPAIINMEMGTLRRILKRAKRWHIVGADIRPFREPRTIGRAMDKDEKLRLLRFAAQNPDWQNARLAATLALNTTMRGCEIKQLCWKDVDLMERTIVIRKSKTEAGERAIPLNAEAYSAMRELRGAALKLSGPEAEHFVFPSCEHGRIDPTKPQKSWRSAWRHLTKAIECPACGELQKPTETCCNRACKADIKEIKSPSAKLRFHDLRHHAITELAESKASDQTIMAIAGHVSARMLAHYSHVRLDAKRSALDALSRVSPEVSTQHSESSDSEARQKGHVTSGGTIAENQGEALG
jgi:integrase